MRRRLVPDVVKEQVLAILPGSASARDAALLMRARRIGAVLVAAAGGRLEGIFTERDLVCRVVAADRDPAATRLDAVMTRDPACARPGDSAIDALRAMHDGGFRHLPILDGDRLVAIVSRRDFDGLEQARLELETGLFETLR